MFTIIMIVFTFILIDFIRIFTINLIVFIRMFDSEVKHAYIFKKTGVF